MADDVIADPGAGGATFRSREDTSTGSPRHWPGSIIGWGGTPPGAPNEIDDVDGKRLPIKPHMASNAARTSVNDSAIAVSLLASNANRKGAYILNTSSAILYVGLGTVDPTSSDFTEQLMQWQSWRVPDCFTGQIKGIWASDPGDGVARVTELT